MASRSYHEIQEQDSLFSWYITPVLAQPELDWRGLERAWAVVFHGADPVASPSLKPAGGIALWSPRPDPPPHGVLPPTAARHNRHRATAHEAASFNSPPDRARAPPCLPPPRGLRTFLYPAHVPFS
jgi:hypothetical protein